MRSALHLGTAACQLFCCGSSTWHPQSHTLHQRPSSKEQPNWASWRACLFRIGIATMLLLVLDFFVAPQSPTGRSLDGNGEDLFFLVVDSCLRGCQSSLAWSMVNDCSCVAELQQCFSLLLRAMASEQNSINFVKRNLPSSKYHSSGSEPASKDFA